jgi:hypothetical protein
LYQAFLVVLLIGILAAALHHVMRYFRLSVARKGRGVTLALVRRVDDYSR